MADDPSTPDDSLERLLLDKDLLVSVGPGGVGKTTISAAMALQSARMGRNTLVLTIDPARRLAQALGLDGLDDAVQEVSIEELRATGMEVKGKLYAAMLDTGASFDTLMSRIAPNPQVEQRILNNRVYRAMAGTLARSHAYVAMERLYEVMEDERFDLVILDTPPTRNALDILDAPGALMAFLEENVVKWFVRKPAKGLRGRLWNTGSVATTRLLGMLAGQDFLEEVISFFESFYELREGFSERADRARAYLRHPRSAFVIVTSADPANLEDAKNLAEGVRSRGVRIAAAVFNRCYEPIGEDRLEVITKVDPRPPEQALDTLWPNAPARARVKALLEGLGEVEARAAASNARSERTIAAFQIPGRSARVMVARLDNDIRDLVGLAELSPWLCPDWE